MLWLGCVSLVKSGIGSNWHPWPWAHEQASKETEWMSTLLSLMSSVTSKCVFPSMRTLNWDAAIFLRHTRNIHKVVVLHHLSLSQSLALVRRQQGFFLIIVFFLVLFCFFSKFNRLSVELLKLNISAQPCNAVEPCDIWLAQCSNSPGAPVFCSCMTHRSWKVMKMACTLKLLTWTCCYDRNHSFFGGNFISFLKFFAGWYFKFFGMIFQICWCSG